MNVTNKLGLPAALVRAIENDGYVTSRGKTDLSVTELIAPPRLVALRRAHDAELTEDAADRIWSLLGQAIHTILERAADRNALAEQRLFTVVEGWRISGQLDHYVLDEEGTLSDYKVSSTWSAKSGGKDEWTNQLNVLAWLLRLHSFTVKQLRIVLLCRDWRRNEYLRYGDPYPAMQVAILPVLRWPDEAVEPYVVQRVRLHQAARRGYNAEQPSLPYCTDEERWKRPTQWAVMKQGRKSAVKLCATEADALAVVGDAPAKQVWVTRRPGLAVRCAQYCPVREQCCALSDGQHQPGDLGGEDADEAAA